MKSQAESLPASRLMLLLGVFGFDCLHFAPLPRLPPSSGSHWLPARQGVRSLTLFLVVSIGCSPPWLVFPASVPKARPSF